MRKLNIFESAIIGLLVGVVASTYYVFLSSTDSYVGNVIAWISLKPIMVALEIGSGQLLATFLFIVGVFVIYGVIVGLIVRIGKKTKMTVASLAVLILVAGYFDQTSTAATTYVAEQYTVPYVAAVVKAVPKVVEEPQQYFGQLEATGDLTGDGVDDVAFIISRNDPDRGMLYYLSAALKTTTGHSGTNLLFLGDKIEPKALVIANKMVDVAYVNHSKKNATTTLDMFAQVVDGNLELVKSVK